MTPFKMLYGQTLSSILPCIMVSPTTGHLAQIPWKEISYKIWGNFKHLKDFELGALLFSRIHVNHFGIFIYIDKKEPSFGLRFNLKYEIPSKQEHIHDHLKFPRNFKTAQIERLTSLSLSYWFVKNFSAGLGKHYNRNWNIESSVFFRTDHLVKI